MGSKKQKGKSEAVSQLVADKRSSGDRIKAFLRVPASKIRPNPRNARIHSDAQREAWKRVCETIGWADALLVAEDGDGKYVCLDGHLRIEDAGDREVPVLVLDLDEAEQAALLLSFDKLGSMAEYDFTKVGELMTELQAREWDTGALAWSEEERKGLAGAGSGEVVDAEAQVDRAAELQAEWGTRTGQLWEVEGKAGVHRVLCGDSTRAEDVGRLMGNCLADGLVTDPPYSSGGFTRGDRTANTTTKYIQSGTKVNRPDFAGDNRDQRSWISWCERWLAMFLQRMTNGAVLAVWTDWRQLPAMTDAVQGGGWIWRGICAWDKTEAARPLYGRFRPQCEYVIWGSAGTLALNDGRPTYPGVFRHPVERQGAPYPKTR